MNKFFAGLGVVAGLVVVQTVSSRPRSVPPIPRVAPVVPPRNAEEKLLGVRQGLVGVVDTSGSLESQDPLENEAAWRGVAAYYYWFIREAMPESEAELFLPGTTPGRPKSRWRCQVPRGQNQRRALAERALAEIPSVVAVAVRERKANPGLGSPLLQDVRALFGTVAPGERVTFLLASDLEEQSTLFPSTAAAGNPEGWKQGVEALPRPEAAPERILTLHVQTRSGQTPGRVQQLQAIFERYFRYWGTREFFRDEL